MKTIAIKKEQSKSIAEDIQSCLDKLKDEGKNAYYLIGFAEGTLERILKQLKGEYPIV